MGTHPIFESDFDCLTDISDMSSVFYNKLWDRAVTQLEEINLQYEPAPDAKPLVDSKEVMRKLISLFVRYSQSFIMLDECYDQVVHPQKNRSLRVLLDSVMGRLVEIKFEMINLEKTEFHYLDDICQDMKLTPSDIELPVPKYFKFGRDEAFALRSEVLQKILKSIGDRNDVKNLGPQMTTDEAIKLLQIHERARQGRLRAKFMWELSREEERRLKGAKGSSHMTEKEAAIIVQKKWRGYIARQKVKKQRAEELEFIGMIPSRKDIEKDNPEQYRATKTSEARRDKLKQHENEYQRALVDIKQNLLDTKGPLIREELQDQIRQWFIECRDNSGKFPDYPSVEDGGSAKLFVKKTPSEIEAEIAEKEAKKEAKGKKGKKGKKDKKEKKGKKGKGKKGKGGDEDEEPGWKMPESEFKTDAEKELEEYEGKWRRRNEQHNFQQRHDAEIIKEEKMIEVEDAVRLQVDEIMREELENLKAALDKSKGKKGKGKKGKKGKGKKGQG